MFLKEFINNDKKDETEDDRYVSSNDTSILKDTDTRKTRLTLKIINDIRKASELHEKEKKEELGLIRKMYALPPAPAQ